MHCVAGIGVFSGIALECRDPAALASFYSALTGWPVVYSSADWVSIGDGRDALWHLSFQRTPGHAAPQWPDEAGSMQFHLHIRVPDLEAASVEVAALGGVRHPHQPNETGSRVFLDPAGHPFCLVS